MGVLRTNQYSNKSFFLCKPLATKMCLCFRQVVTAKLNENVNCNQEYNNEILFDVFSRHHTRRHSSILNSWFWNMEPIRILWRSSKSQVRETFILKFSEIQVTFVEWERFHCVSPAIVVWHLITELCFVILIIFRRGGLLLCI